MELFWHHFTLGLFILRSWVSLASTPSEQTQQLCTLFANITNLPAWWNCSQNICDDWTSSTNAFTCLNNSIQDILLQHLNLTGELFFNFESENQNDTFHNTTLWPETIQALNLSFNRISGSFDFASLPEWSVQDIDLRFNKIESLLNLDTNNDIVFSGVSTVRAGI